MKPLQKIFQTMIVLMLLCTLSVTSVQPITALHPLNAYLAETEGAATLHIIIQKADHTKQAEDLVLKLGGKITKDLHIINAFAAIIPAGAVHKLEGKPFIKWVSIDAPVSQSDDDATTTTNDDTSSAGTTLSDGSVTTTDLNTSASITSNTSVQSMTSSTTYGGFYSSNSYLYSIRANKLRTESPDLQGRGVTVAILDSGIAANRLDLLDGHGNSRVLTSVDFAQDDISQNDSYGHGTHVAGIIGGNGAKYRGIYTGVAPKVNFVDVKVTDAQGRGNESDVISGLQWVYDNKNQYNIRIVNLSLNSSSPQPYQTSPLDAALEVLWFNQIVVVVSAGNNGSGENNGILFPPANDPFVITVGAVNDQHTNSIQDDVLATYSAFGVTESGFNKPEIVAPGSNIVSILAGSDSQIAREHPTHIVSPYYFRMSGTSMAAAVTSGAVALLLQSNPDLNPDQVKFRLMSTTRSFAGGTGTSYLDIYSAVRSGSGDTANTGLPISQLISLEGTEDVSGSVMWNSVMWNSVMWNSVMWNSVMWNSVMWNSVMWNSDYWGD